jgi:large subunit ribosomal protein L1
MRCRSIQFLEKAKMMEEKTIQEALQALRKEEKRKFIQSIDLIVNLQKFNTKKDSVNVFVELPHLVKEKKVCAFFETASQLVNTITPAEFAKYKEIKDIKKLAKSYDFFIAQASVMPKVAIAFGRFLGQLGKMPSPQLGILMSIDEKNVKELLQKVNRSVKIKSKEASLKILIGKESMKDEEIIENIKIAHQAILKVLPRGKENIKNVIIKFTMSSPFKIKSL